MNATENKSTSIVSQMNTWPIAFFIGLLAFLILTFQSMWNFISGLYFPYAYEAIVAPFFIYVMISIHRYGSGLPVNVARCNLLAFSIALLFSPTIYLLMTNQVNLHEAMFGDFDSTLNHMPYASYLPALFYVALFAPIKNFIQSESTEKKEGIKVKPVDDKKNYIAAFEAWHKRMSENQIKLKETFTLDSLTAIPVNVWDECEDGGTTFAYVEKQNVPDSVCCDVMLHILRFIRSNQVITSTGVEFGLRFYDSSTAYPALIGNPELEFSLFKRWELTIKGADPEKLEIIVEELKAVPPFEGKPINVYSES